MAADCFSRRTVLLTGASACLLPQTSTAQSVPPDAEGGIGGTGIVGVLSDFGSLIVAGLRVSQTGQTRYTDAFGTMQASALQIGDSLTVEAFEKGDQTTAARVHLTQPLIGLAEKSVAHPRGLTVNGIEVLAKNSALQDLIGHRVSVSGIWRENNVVASRVALTDREDDLVAGDIKRLGIRTQIGTTVLRGRGIATVPNGTFATVKGRYDPAARRFRTRSLNIGRFTGAAGALKRLRVEGYLDPINTAPGFRISGLGHSFERGLDLSPYAQSRTLFSGAYTGLFQAQTATVLPDDGVARRRLLRSLSQR